MSYGPEDPPPKQGLREQVTLASGLCPRNMRHHRISSQSVTWGGEELYASLPRPSSSGRGSPGMARGGPPCPVGAPGWLPWDRPPDLRLRVLGQTQAHVVGCAWGTECLVNCTGARDNPTPGPGPGELGMALGPRHARPRLTSPKHRGP